MTGTVDVEAPEQSLRHYPVPLFGMVMGLAGLTLAMHQGELAYGMDGHISSVLYYLTFAVFALVSVGYIAKLVKYPGAVVSEWKHPVRLSFFPAISISLLLLATASQRSLLGR